MNGYERLMADVMRDCSDTNKYGQTPSCGCFNPNGCTSETRTIGEYGQPGFKRCDHSFCNKFKWIIDRAKHYGEKTGIPWEKILDSWEAHRDYWYMNYYQECNQPEIKEGRVRIFDNDEDFRKSVGDKGFRCPKCGRVSKSPYECTAEGCDWKAYGLFGTLGKGIYVFNKSEAIGDTIFMPVAWEVKMDEDS